MGEKFVLGRYTRVGEYGTGGLFGAGSQEKMIGNYSLWAEMVMTAAQWITPTTLAAAYSAISHLEPIPKGINV